MNVCSNKLNVIIQYLYLFISVLQSHTVTFAEIFYFTTAHDEMSHCKKPELIVDCILIKL